MKVLIADDEKRLADTIVELLEQEKISADAVYDGESAADFAMSGIYDLVILDIMMPKLNGIEVLKILRKNNFSQPILMLTAKSEVSDKIEGLNSGADDYLAKPFNTRELVARVRALSRRKGEYIGDSLTYGDIELDRATFELRSRGKCVMLGKKEFEIMEMLLANPKMILQKERIAEKIWGYDSAADYNNVEVYISFLRKKLNLIGASVGIRVVRGIGYTLEETDV